jgi:hypothetical protein
VEAVVVIVETAVAVEMKLLLQHHQALNNLYLVLSVKVLTAVLVQVFNKLAAVVELVKLVELQVLLVLMVELVKIYNLMVFLNV